MTDFNMPGADATFEARGGWITKSLAAEFGLTLSQAAGLVGNLGFESGGLKKLREIGQPEGKGGYGWGQWTADRRVTFLAFAKQHGLDWHSDEANYSYLMSELHGAYRNTIVKLKQASDLGAAVFSVGQTYERPGGTTAGHLPGYAERLAWAKRALAGAQGVAAVPILPTAGIVPRPATPRPAKPYSMPAARRPPADNSEAEAERLNTEELDKH